MSADEALSFGKIRSLLWPIHRHELAKFVPMLAIFFLIAFNYSILRAAKDTLIVTSPYSGAEAIPFIKVWAMLPMAFFITFLFTKLSNKHSREKVFYIMVIIFISFFALFTFVLYPLREVLHPHAFAEYLETILPQGYKGFIAIVRNWPCTAFYVMAELWSTAILSVLFWGFANDVTTVKEAKRFYVIFGVGANIATILSGQTSIFLSSKAFYSWLHLGNNAWEQSLSLMNCVVILSGIAIIFIFRHLNKHSVAANEIKMSDAKEDKVKISLKQSFAYLGRSKYLICIALLVLGYNLTISMVEIAWKDQIKLLYPNPCDFSAYLGKILTWIGAIAALVALFVSGKVLRKFSWTFGAMIAPAIVLITGVFFFSFLLFDQSYATSLALIFGSTPLVMSVFFGALQNSLSRASKYTLFDATKEIAFIPLSKESRLKGKAAIDGVGSRIGKSGSSILYQGLFLFCSTVGATVPYVAIIFFAVLVVWFIAIISLGKQFNALTAKPEPLDIDAKIVKASSNQEGAN
ncbi:MAG: NTP/NDP exchange transporter [Chlamydiae bacterium]|nr:NTP/NDP exchange transporter [Chlamydiota bacterium]